MKTYWVEYNYSYDDILDGEMEHFEDSDSGRFNCRKKDIKKEVEAAIKEDFCGTEKNLKIEITDCYITTDYEI